MDLPGTTTPDVVAAIRTVLPLDDAPKAYAQFRAKEDGMVKVVFTP